MFVTPFGEIVLCISTNLDCWTPVFLDLIKGLIIRKTILQHCYFCWWSKNNGEVNVLDSKQIKLLNAETWLNTNKLSHEKVTIPLMQIVSVILNSVSLLESECFKYSESHIQFKNILFHCAHWRGKKKLTIQFGTVSKLRYYVSKSL